MFVSGFLRASLLGVVLGASLSAFGQNIVRDGDIESAPVGAYRPGDAIDGNWTAFNVTGDANTLVVDGNTPYGSPISGSRDVFLVQSGVQQVLATTATQAYSISFDVTALNSTDLTLTFGGTTLTTLVDGSSGVSHLSFVANATSASTLLGVSTDTFNHLDNVSVQAVPEPATWAALGLGALGLMNRRRRA